MSTKIGEDPSVQRCKTKSRQSSPACKFNQSLQEARDISEICGTFDKTFTQLINHPSTCEVNRVLDEHVSIQLQLQEKLNTLKQKLSAKLFKQFDPKDFLGETLEEEITYIDALSVGVERGWIQDQQDIERLASAGLEYWQQIAVREQQLSEHLCK